MVPTERMLDTLFGREKENWLDAFILDETDSIAIPRDPKGHVLIDVESRTNIEDCYIEHVIFTNYKQWIHSQTAEAGEENDLIAVNFLAELMKEIKFHKSRY